MALDSQIAARRRRKPVTRSQAIVEKTGSTRSKPLKAAEAIESPRAAQATAMAQPTVGVRGPQDRNAIQESSETTVASSYCGDSQERREGGIEAEVDAHRTYEGKLGQGVRAAHHRCPRCPHPRPRVWHRDFWTSCGFAWLPSSWDRTDSRDIVLDVGPS